MTVCKGGFVWHREEGGEEKAEDITLLSLFARRRVREKPVPATFVTRARAVHHYKLLLSACHVPALCWLPEVP